MRAHTKDWSTEERWSSYEYSKYIEVAHHAALPLHQVYSTCCCPKFQQQTGLSNCKKLSQPALTLQCFVVQDLVLISTYKGLSA